MRFASWSITALFIAATLFGMAGCGGPTARSTVKGQVKLGEKNLTAGTVIFTSIKDNTSGTGSIDPDGNYVMRDAPLGDVKISVTVPRAMMGKIDSKMAKAPADVGKMPEGVAGPGGIDPSKFVPIPDKYSSPETSGLTYKVESGEQTHNITLTP